MERATSKYKRGDVLQISPDEEMNGRVRGCIGIFTGEYKPGVEGDELFPLMMVIAPSNEQHLIVFRDSDVDFIGRATFMPETEWMPVLG